MYNLVCDQNLKNQILVLGTKIIAGGPRILWFLVPMGNHEMRGSWIPGTVFSVKPQNASNIFQKSTFWAFVHDFFPLFQIEIAS